MPKEREQREHLDYIYKDRVFSAGYTVSSGMVHVTAVQGRKSGQRCELTDHAVAERLFREIILEADAAGTLRWHHKARAIKAIQD